MRYHADPELEAAIAAHRDWIAGETLTDNYFDVPFQLVTPENLGDFLK